MLDTRAVTNNRFNRTKLIQVANRLIESKLMNRFTETIHCFYLFNGIVAKKMPTIGFLSNITNNIIILLAV